MAARQRNKAIQLLLMTVVALLAVQISVTAVLEYALGDLHLPALIVDLLQDFLSMGVVYPVLYILVFRPLVAEINRRSQMEEAWQTSNDKLGLLVKDLEQRTRETTLLGEMSDLLQACPTIEETYSVLTKFLEQLFAVEAGALFLSNSPRNELEAVAVWGAFPGNADERVFLPDECWGLRRGRLYAVEDLPRALYCPHLQSTPPAGYLCMPLAAQGEVLGLLHLRVKPAESLRPGEEHQDMAEVRRLATRLGEHIAPALANLRLRETLRIQSVRDPLTGLFNRRYMEETLERELRRAVRRAGSLGVIMLDVDHFKRFNDSFGHDGGDALLRELGHLLLGNIRREDVACRYGGEEFTLILPEASLEVTRLRAEKLRQEMESLTVMHHGEKLGRVTLSLGVASFPEHAQSADALLKMADRGLYRAKQEGRNRVVIEGMTAPPAAEATSDPPPALAAEVTG